MFGNSFAVWVINAGIAFVWLVVAVGSGSYFLGIGAVLFIAVSFLIELPSTDSTEGNTDDTDNPWNWP